MLARLTKGTSPKTYSRTNKFICWRDLFRTHHQEISRNRDTLARPRHGTMNRMRRFHRKRRFLRMSEAILQSGTLHKMQRFYRMVWMYKMWHFTGWGMLPNVGISQDAAISEGVAILQCWALHRMGRFYMMVRFLTMRRFNRMGRCCWNISHGTVLKICPYKPSAMI